MDSETVCWRRHGQRNRHLLVGNNVIVELKAVDKLQRVHEAQLLSYLKLSGASVGLLINFCVPQLRLGIRRLVNNYIDPRHSRKRDET